ncbi:hypothetical protein D3C81_2017860 [compost metagenome]
MLVQVVGVGGDDALRLEAQMNLPIPSLKVQAGVACLKLDTHVRGVVPEQCRVADQSGQGYTGR